MNIKYPSAVCLLYPRVNQGDITFMAVTRPGSSMWGLPGDKVEDFESNIEAIQREVAEEIGVISSVISYEPIFSGLCKGSTNYWMTTYAWNDTSIVLEAGLLCGWLTKAELCDKSISPFAEYNQRMFESYEEAVNYGAKIS